MRRAFLLLFLVSAFAFGQDTRLVKVGVPVLLNNTGRSVPPLVERDRLLRALNDLKADKKTGIKLSGIPLEGSTGNEITDEAQQKQCDYVLYTTLTELRKSGDPYQRRPGTIETNPNSQWGARSPEDQALASEYRATVEYKLYSITSHSNLSGAQFSTQGTDEIQTVSQVLDRIANRVFSEIKKEPTPMHE